MKFRLEGKEIELGSIRVGEACEAEKALNLDMDSGSMSRFAVMLFVAQRRAEPNKPAALLADEVMRADITKFEEIEEDDAGPPAESADMNGEAPESLPTIGRPLSAPSA